MTRDSRLVASIYLVRSQAVQVGVRSFGVVEVGRSLLPQSLLQSRHAETGPQSVGKTPGEVPAGVPVHHHYQVHESVPHGDVGDIGRPSPIGSVDDTSRNR